MPQCRVRQVLEQQQGFSVARSPQQRRGITRRRGCHIESGAEPIAQHDLRGSLARRGVNASQRDELRHQGALAHAGQPHHRDACPARLTPARRRGGRSLHQLSRRFADGCSINGRLTCGRWRSAWRGRLRRARFDRVTRGSMGQVITIAAQVFVDLAIAGQLQDAVHGVIEQIAVVRDDDGGSLEALQRRLQDLGGGDVDVVGGLVQHQQVVVT